jgi:maltooligosyltrehalose trehalohydrolase
MLNELRRRMPVGAEVISPNEVHFRVWAPRRKKVSIVLEEESETETKVSNIFELSPESNGYFSGVCEGAREGSLYRFKLDNERNFYPDPVSRFQPNGPHGSSRVVDPTTFQWTDEGWPGIKLESQILYEMHLGTFSPEGTFRGAARFLEHLQDLGVTVIELMPIADFVGGFGWGYDGVNLFAPSHLYGEPDDVRSFIDKAHSLGLGVILDVVYNHLGPDGNYLRAFSDDYFTDRYHTDWGEAINFDGKSSGPVREFFIANAEYWMREYHFDGLRLDATTEIFDKSPTHVLTELSRKSRKAAAGKSIVLIAENETQNTNLVRSADDGGYGLDALWNDDFHHTAMVVLTGRSEAYYSGYRGTPQEFISLMKWGFLYQGQYFAWQKKRRGTPTFRTNPAAFVVFLENHDQVANSLRGLRRHQVSSPGVYRALSALMLLGHGTPMLFQGQEFAASTPFFYFADHNPELSRQVFKGRKKFLRQFSSIAAVKNDRIITHPSDPQVFQACILDHSERERNQSVYRFHKDLIHLRKTQPVFLDQSMGTIDGAVLGISAFVLRFFAKDGLDLIMTVNLGPDLLLDPAPEPLLAPPLDMQWEILWSSEDIRYGGNGIPALDKREIWMVPGYSATVLHPVRVER